MKISFVLPALNESKNIARTISSIRTQCDSHEDFTYEILLVDNGSTDNTVNIANNMGANVYSVPNSTIAGLRNYGADEATGDVLIFLDADIQLTPDWSNAISDTISEISSAPEQISGSHVIPPENNNLFHKYWFSAIASEPDTAHIGSAHMIIEKKFFKRLDGFDPNLVTSEDYDICQRAKANGGKVVNNRDLKVIHPDFPRKLDSFIRREIWHGLGDCLSFRTAIKSKILIASIVFYVLIISSVISLLFGAMKSGLIFAVTAASLLLAVSWLKFHHAGFRSMLINSLILIPYFFARIISVFKSL